MINMEISRENGICKVTTEVPEIHLVTRCCFKSAFKEKAHPV